MWNRAHPLDSGIAILGLPQSQENKLEKNENFVIGSSCAVEAFSSQGKLDLSKLEG